MKLKYNILINKANFRRDTSRIKIRPNTHSHFFVGHHVGHLVHLHVGHHSLVSTYCETLTEWKYESITDLQTDRVGARDTCVSKKGIYTVQNYDYELIFRFFMFLNINVFDMRKS